MLLLLSDGHRYEKHDWHEREYDVLLLILIKELNNNMNYKSKKFMDINYYFFHVTYFTDVVFHWARFRILKIDGKEVLGILCPVNWWLIKYLVNGKDYNSL